MLTTELGVGEHRLLRLYADLCALTRPRRDQSRRGDGAQPAGVPVRVPALARRARRAAAGALRRAARTRARALRHREPRPHGGARERLLPALPLPAAPAARRAPSCWRSSTAASRRPRPTRQLREVLDELEAATEGRDDDRGRARARAALRGLRRAARRRGPRGGLRRDGRAPGRAGERSAARRPRRARCARSSPARACWRRCSPRAWPEPSRSCAPRCSRR